MLITAVLAMTDSLLIGASDHLPWHLPEDMKHFKEVTAGKTVIMGKNTYFSLPEKFRPLPGRRNVVLTRSAIEGVECFSDIGEMVAFLKNEGIAEACVIGGAQVYDAFFEKGLVDRVELTIVKGDYEGDIHVKEFRHGFREVKRETLESVNFVTLEKV